MRPIIVPIQSLSVEMEKVAFYRVWAQVYIFNFKSEISLFMPYQLV